MTLIIQGTVNISKKIAVLFYSLLIDEFNNEIVDEFDNEIIGE